MAKKNAKIRTQNISEPYCQTPNVKQMRQTHPPNPWKTSPLTWTWMQKFGWWTGPICLMTSYFKPGIMSFKATTGFFDVKESFNRIRFKGNILLKPSELNLLQVTTLKINLSLTWFQTVRKVSNPIFISQSISLFGDDWWHHLNRTVRYTKAE